MTSSQTSSSKSWLLIAGLITRAGWVLIGLNLILLGFSIFPLKTSDPTWQLRFISQLLALGSPTFLGAVLVCLGCQLAGDQPKLIQQARILRTASAWLSILLFVLIPLQFWAPIKAINAQTQEGKVQLRVMKNTIEKIRNADTELELRQILASLPNPVTLPVKLDAPFPVIRQRGVENMQNRYHAMETQLEQEKQTATQQSLVDSIRNSSSLVLLGLGFAWIPLSDPGQRTVMRSLVLFVGDAVSKKRKRQSRNKLSEVVNPDWIDPDQR